MASQQVKVHNNPFQVEEHEARTLLQYEDKPCKGMLTSDGANKQKFDMKNPTPWHGYCNLETFIMMGYGLASWKDIL